ncbi:MAG: phosphopyruvate hydratase [bacterium]|nr:phosphopyruvate hydratase [bacterium]
MAKIQWVNATEILDSRGNPTIETTIALDDGVSAARASVPSGASLGKYEAIELRDNDPNRFNGMGVLKAVGNVNNAIGSAIMGKDPQDQVGIDKLLLKLDGTPNKGNLGGNAILSVSLAVCKVAAFSLKMPLYKYINKLAFNINLPVSIEKMPTPTFNLINGGKHGAGNLDFQEFHVIPASHKPYHEGLRLGDEIYQKVRKVLDYRNAIHSVGDEGGFAPNLFTNMDALEILIEAIKETPYKLSYDVFLGLDVAATHFKKGGHYQIKDHPEALAADDLIKYYQHLQENYHLLILEDPLGEDDWNDWAKLMQIMGNTVTIVGDDLFATNPERLKKGIDEKVANAILVKPNQIGTLTETLAVVKQAKDAGFKTIVSHRSGETNDTYIADLAVGLTADYVKFGAPARGERVAKYNRLLEIEHEIFLS